MSGFTDPEGPTLGFLRELADEDTTWKLSAACRGLDPAIFFPTTQGQNCTATKRVCATCPVTFECADYGAKFSPREGVWGGLSIRERRRWRKTRGLRVGQSGRKCGTDSAYAGGCRCDLCRSAHAQYQRRYQARRAS